MQDENFHIIWTTLLLSGFILRSVSLEMKLISNESFLVMWMDRRPLLVRKCSFSAIRSKWHINLERAWGELGFVLIVPVLPSFWRTFECHILWKVDSFAHTFMKSDLCICSCGKSCFSGFVTWIYHKMGDCGRIMQIANCATASTQDMSACDIVRRFEQLETQVLIISTRLVTWD